MAYDLEALGLGSNLQGFGTPQKQQPKKKKNFFLDQISTIGGIAGGIGGSLLAPIAGTAAGGAAGAGLGETIENLIMGESATKNVGKEALLGGVFAGGPGKLAKAGLGAVTGRTAAKEAGEAVTRTAGERLGQNLLGDAWGIRSGVKLAGKELTPQKAKGLQSFVTKQIGVPKTAGADQVFERVVNFQDEAGRGISAAVSLANPLKRNQASGLVSSLEGKFGKVIGGRADTSGVAQDILSQVKSAKTPSQLWDVRKRIDDTLVNFNANPSSATPAAQQFARTARGEINKVLNASVPEFKALSGKYSQAADIRQLVAGAAKTPKGTQLPGFLGRVGGNTTQTVKSGLGQAISGVAGPMSSSALPQGMAAAKGIAGREIGQNLLLPRSDTGGDFQDPASLEEAIMQGGSQDPFGGAMQQPQQQDPYPRENLLADIQRDPKNADKYLSYYKELQDVFNPVTEQKPMGAAQQQKANTAQSGLRSIDVLNQTLQSDPGAFAKQFLPNPLGLTARFTGTGDIRAATDNVVDVIARLRSGAAITNEEAARFARQLPQSGDKPDLAARKLQSVAQELQAYAFPQQGGGGLEDYIMQAQGGGY